MCSYSCIFHTESKYDNYLNFKKCWKSIKKKNYLLTILNTSMEGGRERELRLGFFPSSLIFYFHLRFLFFSMFALSCSLTFTCGCLPFCVALSQSLDTYLLIFHRKIDQKARKVEEKKKYPIACHYGCVQCLWRHCISSLFILVYIHLEIN